MPMREAPNSPAQVRIEALWPWLHKSPRLFAKAIRFALVGGLNGCVFAGVTALLVSGLGAAPIPASIAGYCVSVPMGFVGHRQFSFRSSGHWLAEGSRFVAVQLANIAATAGSMYLAVDRLGVAYYWGMVAAIVVVPLLNFALANLWVFAGQAKEGDTP
jgi:putative flippase GtrA